MPKFVAVLLIAILCTAGCAGLSALATSSSASDRIAAGVSILDGCVVAAESALATAKTQYPDQAAAIEKAVRPILSELSTAVTAFKTASASDSQTKWDAAWTLAVKASEFLIPAAVEAVVAAR